MLLLSDANSSALRLTLTSHSPEVEADLPAAVAALRSSVRVPLPAIISSHLVNQLLHPAGGAPPPAPNALLKCRCKV